MKKIIFTITAILGLTVLSNAQITVEQTYPINKNSSKFSGLTLIKLDVSGDKYLFYDIQNKYIKLYNLNHSLFKSFPIPPLKKYRESEINKDSTVGIAYISENLFNSDNLIEFVSYDDSYAASAKLEGRGSMHIFNELGKIVFNGDSLLPVPKISATYYGYKSDAEFIFNTSSGTKMILFSYKNNNPTQVVYSLPGKLVAGINNEEYEKKNNLLPYPNPSSDKITIAYKLDNEKEGKLIITDLSGRSLLEYRIDNVFDNVIIDTKSLVAGTYLYSIYSSDKKLTTGKFMVTN